MKDRLLAFALVLIGFLSEGVCADSLQGSELPPQVFLNRITRRLIGRGPTPAEVVRLNEAMRSKGCGSVSCLDSYFRNTIREKMDDPKFYAIAYSKVMERVGYKSPSSVSLTAILESARMTGEASLGRDFMLVYRTFKENRSIDELFTSQTMTDPVYPNVEATVDGYDRFAIDVSNLRVSATEAKPYSFQSKRVVEWERASSISKDIRMSRDYFRAHGF